MTKSVRSQRNLSVPSPGVGTGTRPRGGLPFTAGQLPPPHSWSATCPRAVAEGRAPLAAPPRQPGQDGGYSSLKSRRKVRARSSRRRSPVLRPTSRSRSSRSTMTSLTPAGSWPASFSRLSWYRRDQFPASSGRRTRSAILARGHPSQGRRMTAAGRGQSRHRCGQLPRSCRWPFSPRPSCAAASSPAKRRIMPGLRSTWTCASVAFSAIIFMTRGR